MTRSPKILYGYAAAVATAGTALLFALLIKGFPSTHTLMSAPFLLLAAGVLVGEFIRIRVPHRQETVTVTVGDPFTLSLLFIFGLGPAVLVKVCAAILDDAHRRQTWWKAWFNIGQFTLSLGFCYLMVSLVGHDTSLATDISLLTVLATLLGAFAYFIFNMAVVTTAISLAIGESPLKSFRNNIRTRVIQQGALLGFTPIVAVAIHDSILLFPLLLIPILVVYHSGSLTQRHVQTAQQLGQLYETTRMTSARVGAREPVKELLTRVCDMFNASSASILFFAREGDETPYETSIHIDSGTFRYMEPASPDPTRGIWARATAERKALMLPSPIENEALASYYSGIGVKDLIVAPMLTEDVANGVISVFNRRGDTQTFTSEDVRLFETLANHASIALENARLIGQLEDSLAHLTEMNQLKDDFVAAVSHELRTPLTSIEGYVKTLLRPDANFEPDIQKSFLETIDRQAGRLHRLIEDLLVVSRLETEDVGASIRLVDLEELIGHIVVELRDRVTTHELEVHLSPDLPVLETDAGKVHQIVSNFVENALKYTPDGTAVSISADPQGEGIAIVVKDKGEGIPKEAQEKIFDRFYQVDQSSTRKKGGTGLGLYICRKLAEAIGGRVWLERSDETGSDFALWVPCKPPHNVSHASRENLSSFLATVSAQKF